jgi:hypothetical protein
MAAATLVLGVPQDITTGTADNVRLVNLPTGHGWIKLRPASAAKFIRNYAGADDAAIGAAAYETMDAGSDFTVDTAAGAPKIGIASATGTVVVQSIVMGR